MSSRPTSVTGGCLCGSIRYTIKFPDGSPWPPNGRAICMCTMCRKHTGSLMPPLAAIPIADIEPPLASAPSFKLYKSSDKASRSFCGKCGSSIGFHEDATPDQAEIFLGTIDEDCLCGTKVEGTERTDEYGTHFQREGGCGKVLCEPDHWNWTVNDVPGVTDLIPGKKHLQEGDGYQPLPQ